MTERLFSTYQIAKLLDTTLGSITRWMDNGSLRFHRISDGTTRITESALIDFLTEQGINLGEVLAKAGYTKVSTSGDSEDAERQEYSPQEAPDDPDETVTDLAPAESIDDEPDQAIAPPPEQLNTIAPAPADESPSVTVPLQPPEIPRPDMQADQICDAIFADAAAQGAQTIHLTPGRDRLVLQLRIDGALRDKLNFDSNLTDDLRTKIVACVLKRANPDIEPDTLSVPISAEFTQTIEGQDVALRLSALPTVRGARLVIHMPSPTADLELLGLDDSSAPRLEKLLQADGLILVASKRRTGRDLALQALLNATKTNGASVITIGGNSTPGLDNVAHLHIDPPAGLTYATATDAVKHQDADAIVLTELRDPETALNAFEAAHDGSLVIAGTNAHSARQAITQLRAMGIESWPLGGTLKAVIEQASVPLLCEHCKQQSDNSSYEPVGCGRCGHTGWAGRTVLSGIVFTDGQLADLIRTGAPNEQIEHAVAQSPGSLARVARTAVARGLTTPAQTARILRRSSV
ncbi:MAG: ATPase, T2SS/T4P/T4SS family [Phycisphaerae bacterium]|jgi:general secretion pathway protein E|nr:ATPase, T2SS/T4P/T4SS family [Phycisphaerae bacterium]